MKKSSILILLTAILFILFQSCNFSTANISDIMLCEELNSDEKCNENNDIISRYAPNIFVSCKINNAPEGTVVNFAWYYTSEERFLIDAVDVNAVASTTELYSSLSSPDIGWPAGNYEVIISIKDHEGISVTKTFSID